MAQNVRSKTGSVVYIGAGLASNLDMFLGHAPDRIYLIEPNPALKDDLELLCESHASVDYLPIGVTASGGPQTLTVYSFFDISSFAEPQDLMEYFPGVRVERKVTVDTLTPAQLLSRLALPSDKTHHLVIDAPGAEFDLLKAFVSSKASDRFARLHLTMPKNPLFVGHRDANDVASLVLNAGFQYQAEQSDHAHPDWLVDSYQRHPQASSLEPPAADSDTKTSIKSNTQSTDRLQTAFSALDAALADARSNPDLERALDIVLKEARALLKEQDAALTKIKTQLETALRSQKTQEERLKTLKAQLEEGRQELTLSTRLQAMLQSNHQDLQERYEALLQAKQEQDMFLQELLDKLTDAPGAT